MSIKKMLESLPPCPNRRGMLVAIEGSECAGKTHLVNKVKELLGGPEEVVVLNYNMHSHLDIINLLNKGTCVIIENYIISDMVHDMHTNDCYQAMPTRKGFKKILKQYKRNTVVADLTIYLEPDTSTLVNRLIAKGIINTEDEYIFNLIRRRHELFSKLAHSGIIENVVCMTHDPITKETDALNLITMRAAMEMYDRPIKIY
jgi:thymidylate kinase